MALTVTFDIDTDPNIDQVNVTNRVAQAQPNLPPDVNQFGLSYRKSTGLPMLIISLYSPHQRYDALFLACRAHHSSVGAYVTAAWRIVRRRRSRKKSTNTSRNRMSKVCTKSHAHVTWFGRTTMRDLPEAGSNFPHSQ